MHPHEYHESVDKWIDSNVPRKYKGKYLDTIEQDMEITLTPPQKDFVKMLEELNKEVNKYEDNDIHKMILIVGGSIGAGKTMLLSSLINYRNSFCVGGSANVSKYTTLSNLEGSVKRTFGDKYSTDADVIWDYSHYPLLVIDEMKPLISDYQKDVLQQIIVEREANLRAIILCGNIDRRTIGQMFDAHVVNRLEQGRFFIFKGDSFRKGG